MVMTSESSVFIKMTLAKKKKKKTSGNGLEREEPEKWKNQENLHLGLQEFRHLEWVVSVGTKRKEQFPESGLKEAVMELSNQ